MTERSISDAPPPLAEIVRPYGNPLPLGLFCLAVGMVMLAGIGLGLITGTQVRMAGIVLVAFVAPLQFLTAVLAFLARDTMVGSVLGLFGTSWLALGALHITAPTQQTGTAAGMFLAAFAMVIIPLVVVGLFGKMLLGALLTVSAVRAGVSAAYQLGAPHALQLANGWIAFALFGFGLYAGTAFLVEDTRHHPVLPTLRHGAAKQPRQDPGVRRQL